MQSDTAHDVESVQKLSKNRRKQNIIVLSGSVKSSGSFPFSDMSYE